MANKISKNKNFNTPDGIVNSYFMIVYMYVTVDSCNYKLEKDDLCMSELFEMLDSVKVEIGSQGYWTGVSR